MCCSRRCLNGNRATIFPRRLYGCSCVEKPRSCKAADSWRSCRRLQPGSVKTRVVFPGYVTGERKRAFFSLADLYVFPSRHESYGLTLMEALAAGLPAVCLDHHGAREIMRPEFGELVPASGLRNAIARLLADHDRLRKMGEAARAFAQNERFSARAARLAEFLV